MLRAFVVAWLVVKTPEVGAGVGKGKHELKFVFVPRQRQAGVGVGLGARVGKGKDELVSGTISFLQWGSGRQGWGGLGPLGGRGGPRQKRIGVRHHSSKMLGCAGHVP